MTATAPVITGPYTHKNLDVFLIHGNDLADTSHYITLEEAFDQKVIVVHETGNVGELLIENLLPTKDIFIQSGEIVRGGKQDRTLGVDCILAARSGRVPIPSFCVESGRWASRAGEAMHCFSSSKHYLSSKKLKIATKVAADQEQVWKHVAEGQQKLEDSVGAPVRDERSASSLELTLDHEKIKKETEDCLAALTPIVKEKSDTLRFVFAINGKINSGESYASHELFMKLWNKLAHAADSNGNKIPSSDDEKEVLTLLHCAALDGRKEVVTFLLDHKQDVNAATNKGMTPLHSAAIGGHKEVAQLLLENGAKINAKNSLGGAPLLYVALRDHVSTAKVLLKHGADINITDNSGGTPLHFAACEGSRKIARLLLAGGANVNAKDDEGRTPLDVATVEVAYLLRHYRGKRGKTLNGKSSSQVRWERSAPYN